MCTRGQGSETRKVGESYSSVSLFLSDTTWGVPPGVRDGSLRKAFSGAGLGALPGAGHRPGRPGHPLGSGASSGRCLVVPVSPCRELGASENKADVVVNDELLSLTHSCYERGVSQSRYLQLYIYIL